LKYSRIRLERFRL